MTELTLTLNTVATAYTASRDRISALNAEIDAIKATQEYPDCACNGLAPILAQNHYRRFHYDEKP